MLSQLGTPLDPTNPEFCGDLLCHTHVGKPIGPPPVVYTVHSDHNVPYAILQQPLTAHLHFQIPPGAWFDVTKSNNGPYLPPPPELPPARCQLGAAALAQTSNNTGTHQWLDAGWCYNKREPAEDKIISLSF